LWLFLYYRLFVVLKANPLASFRVASWFCSTAAIDLLSVIGNKTRFLLEKQMSNCATQECLINGLLLVTQIAFCQKNLCKQAPFYVHLPYICHPKGGCGEIGRRTRLRI
jgi:hypothetical protein